jgi:acyl-CoA reductase-like NAD-dependent aldehyde dehydrogenase
MRQREDREGVHHMDRGQAREVVPRQRKGGLENGQETEHGCRNDCRTRELGEETEHDRDQGDDGEEVAKAFVRVVLGRSERTEAGEEELDDDPACEEGDDGEEGSVHSRYRANTMATALREYGLHIGGESVDAVSGETRGLTEPANGRPLAQAALAGAEDVDRAVEAARSALEGPWGKTPPNERSRLLHALADAVQENRKELAELEARNVGKAISSVKAELAQGVENFRFYASAIASIGGRSNPLGGSLLSYTLKEPVGVCGQIVPWNYPLMLATWKLAPALAAGCTIVLKPDPATPLTALRLAELAAEAGLPPGTVNVVPGDGPTTGAYLVSHPGVAKVAFTGSTETGSEIMRLAAQPIKRLSLELGGKSPNIVFADADFEDAVPSSVWAIYYSAGQSCEARSRVLVEKGAYDDFVTRFAEAAARLRMGDPLDPETQMGSLVSESHRARVHGFVEAGRGEGAEVVIGGAPADGPGAFYPPTVLAGVENSMTVAQEEIFGPVVTVIPFEDEKEAVRIANDVKYGLFATVWTGDSARGHRLARQIKAGMVGINMPYTAFPGIPFGGYKQSGFGRELGLETLELYLETKGVLVSTGARPFNPFGL